MAALDPQTRSCKAPWVSSSPKQSAWVVLGAGAARASSCSRKEPSVPQSLREGAPFPRAARADAQGAVAGSGAGALGQVPALPASPSQESPEA